MNKFKQLGQVYTPTWIVNEILDEVEYFGKKIINQKIIDNACGDGAFLKIVVDRYISECLDNNLNLEEIIEKLEQNIYGIELDRIAYEKCIDNLNNIVQNKLNKKIQIKWNIYNENTLLKYQDLIGKFDYVVGNPPYIRIHNLDITTRNIIKNNFVFNKGTIDIYVSFFEIGFKILKEAGKLGYITPNSYLHNSSYKNFRKYLKNKKNLKTLIDFKSNKIFDGFSTYTAISIFDFGQKVNSFEYKELKDNKLQKINDINYNDLDDNNWSFSDRKKMFFLNKINNGGGKKIEDFFVVQYGFATLRDKIFIGNAKPINKQEVLFNEFIIEEDLLYKIVKGSRFKGNDFEKSFVIFPYEKKDDKYKPIDEIILKEKYPKTYKYLSFHKNELLKRDIDKGALWYEFGRSQGVQSIHKEKVVLSTLVYDKVNAYKLSKDEFVYSGIFITKKDDKVEWEILDKTLSSKKFFDYISFSGKVFSGGYKGITSNLIKKFPVFI